MTIFQCLSKLYYFLGLDQLPTFYHLHFQCREISPQVPLMRRGFLFLPASLPLGHLYPFPHILISWFLSVSSSGCLSGFSDGSSVFRLLAISPVTPFEFNLSSLPSLSLSISLLQFHLSWPIPSFNDPFL